MTRFRLLRVFNDEDVRGYANARSKIGRHALPYFQGDSLCDRIMRALAEERALALKEVTEAFEFFAVTRRHIERAPVVVDLCSGHGLAGILYAAFSRHTQEVLLCDRRRPLNFDRVLRACIQAAPWVEEKVRYIEGDLAKTRVELPQRSAILGVHACGSLTDTCIEIALGLGGPLAVLPCCRSKAHNRAPEGLRQALGEDVAYDVDRTYAMERAGYRVRWREIPAAITPMNRVLIAVPERVATHLPGSHQG